MILFNKSDTNPQVSAPQTDVQRAQSKLNKVDFNELGLGNDRLVERPKKGDKLDGGDFMTLFIEQLKNQDPMDPQEGADLVAQLAQFSQVEEATKLNKGFQDLAGALQADRMLQATSMIGHLVDVPTNKFFLKADENIKGAVKIPEGEGDQKGVPDLLLMVRDKFGRPVYAREMGEQPAGVIPFEWDGKDNQGNPLEEGEYFIRAEGYFDTDRKSFDTQISTKVESVLKDPETNTLLLKLSNLQSIDYDAVTRVQ